MPLADFLSELRGNAGAIGRAFGGRTTSERNIDTFINQELPAIADGINRATSREDITKGMQSFLSSGLKAGINPQQLDKLGEMLIGPALQGVQQREIDSIRNDYGAKPAQPRPEGTEGPLTQQGNFIDARAERPLDQEGMLRIGQALGANPQGYNQLLRTPAQVAENQAQAAMHQASQRKTEQ